MHDERNDERVVVARESVEVNEEKRRYKRDLVRAGNNASQISQKDVGSPKRVYQNTVEDLNEISRGS